MIDRRRGWLVVAAIVVAACDSSSDDRVLVPGSQPGIACSLVENAMTSRDAPGAVAKAKTAWAAIYAKQPLNDRYSPANLAKFEPYIAVSNGGAWQVKGTAPIGYRGLVPIMSVCRNDEGASASWFEVR